MCPPATAPRDKAARHPRRLRGCPPHRMKPRRWSISSHLGRILTRVRQGFGARRLERVKGIEPSSSAWKAVALPLSYTRAREVPHASPPSPRLRRLPSRSAGLPAAAPQARRLVGEVGLEPTKAKPADLQSAPFAARDTPPLVVARIRFDDGSDCRPAGI